MIENFIAEVAERLDAQPWSSWSRGLFLEFRVVKLRLCGREFRIREQCQTRARSVYIGPDETDRIDWEETYSFDVLIPPRAGEAEEVWYEASYLLQSGDDWPPAQRFEALKAIFWKILAPEIIEG